MADVTISDLSSGTPSGLDVIPYSTGTSTNKVSVNDLKTALNIPAQVNADWNATSGPAQILNKPNTIQQVLFFVKNPNTTLDLTTASTDIGVKGNITLSRATNKVLCMVSVVVGVGTSYQDTRTGAIWIARNGTRVGGMDTNQGALYIGGQGSATYWGSYCSFNYLDTPGSVGPHTYAVFMREITGNNFSVGANSYITLMEVAA